jgi:hypothetical protein
MDDGLLPLSPIPALRSVSNEDQIDAMVVWFFENFEAPDCGDTPYDTEEGRHVFIWGGPFSARDELFAAFGDTVSQEEIQDAWEELELRWSEWAPAAHRVIPPKDPAPSIEDRVAALGGQIDQIEQVVTTLLELQLEDHRRKPGIGHNLPPADDEDLPDRETLLLVRESLEALRQELIKPDTLTRADPATIQAASSRISWLRKKLLWLLGAFATGLVGAAGKYTFDQLIQNPAVFHVIDSTSATLHSWAYAITAAL